MGILKPWGVGVLKIEKKKQTLSEYTSCAHLNWPNYLIFHTLEKTKLCCNKLLQLGNILPIIFITCDYAYHICNLLILWMTKYYDTLTSILQIITLIVMNSAKHLSLGIGSQSHNYSLHGPRYFRGIHKYNEWIPINICSFFLFWQDFTPLLPSWRVQVERKTLWDCDPIPI